ncbi:hypothetical protein [Ferribacterium limneticum]|uniref:hypothetical protein n=1 Tax=Ferribacterium limneticum TaxID=76259 RepID=UPI001CFAF89E|nr:hypothetical protein [Ferribacterium limneticum]UCV18235.1 hypothetical protein KI610_15715 [Ferribacterium limneticum]
MMPGEAIATVNRKISQKMKWLDGRPREQNAPAIVALKSTCHRQTTKTKYDKNNNYYIPIS